MGIKNFWVSAADLDTEGSFCDTQSGTHYDNVSAFELETQIRAAGDRGDNAIIVDAPIDGSDSFGIEQRFNTWLAEEDDQGSDSSAKHRIGGR